MAVPNQRRLQRAPDFTGRRLTTFSAVFLRHGLPGLLLAALSLAHPDLRLLLTVALAGLDAAPLRYLSIGGGVLLAMLVHAAVRDHRIDPRQLGWIVYLLLLSVWEEWLFRIAIPWLGTFRGLDVHTAVLLSNALFGLMHYFTLRWKWHWCLAAFLGGLALSRQMTIHHDLALLIGIHWIATYLNTPRPPRGG